MLAVQTVLCGVKGGWLKEEKDLGGGWGRDQGGLIRFRILWFMNFFFFL